MVGTIRRGEQGGDERCVHGSRCSESGNGKITTPGTSSGCSPPVECEPQHDTVALPRIHGHVPDHLVIGAAYLASQRPRHCVLDVKISDLESIGISERHTASNGGSPLADAGRSGECTCRRRRVVHAGVRDQGRCRACDPPNGVCAPTFNADAVEIEVGDRCEQIRIWWQEQVMHRTGGTTTVGVDENTPLSRGITCSDALTENRWNQFVIRRVAATQPKSRPRTLGVLNCVVVWGQLCGVVVGAQHVRHSPHQPLSTRSEAVDIDCTVREQSDRHGGSTFWRKCRSPERGPVPSGRGIGDSVPKRRQGDGPQVPLARSHIPTVPVPA